MSLKLIKYENRYKKAWDSFINDSHNGTFLFLRDYMEYHSDRFKDYSYLVFEDLDLVAVIPANVTNDGIFYSHGGLTYGGLIHNHKIKTNDILNVFDLLLNTLRNLNFTQIVYKCIPHIYHVRPSEEDLYALFLNKFELYRRDISSTVNLFTTSIPGKKRNRYNKAVKENFEVKETFNSFNLLNIIQKNLLSKYGVMPVHSYNELDMLKKAFPHNIKIFEVYFKSNLLGGAILYISKNVVHVQYMTANEEGLKNRIFDYLFTYLFDIYKMSHRWLDFGISTENNGLYLNSGLISQKEGFNATGICYDSYRLKL
jgi:hypothetical protein